MDIPHQPMAASVIKRSTTRWRRLKPTFISIFIWKTTFYFLAPWHWRRRDSCVAHSFEQNIQAFLGKEVMPYKKLWIAFGLIILVSFSVLGGVGYKAINNGPPIPAK